jgi:hypothetical protein
VPIVEGLREVVVMSLADVGLVRARKLFDLREGPDPASLLSLAVERGVHRIANHSRHGDTSFTSEPREPFCLLRRQ